MTSLDETLAAFDYAKDEVEARRRYNQTRFLDPLQCIDHALLNRVDIARYVEKTAMIFRFDPSKLKSASYEAQLGDEVLYWDDDGNRRHLTGLSRHQTVPLRRNSITYVGLNVAFRLPIYIAVRFNLTITHVHRGLLLGTGPIVDPGYTGRLMIPIHNLTTNDYVLMPGDDLVAIEFTKISSNPRWLSPSEQHAKQMKEDVLEDALLRNVKPPNKSFEMFVQEALPAGTDSIQSSLGQVIGNAERRLREIRQALYSISLGAIFAIAFGVVTVYSLIRDAHQYVTDATTRTQAEIVRLDKAIEALARDTISQPRVPVKEGASKAQGTTKPNDVVREK